MRVHSIDHNFVATAPFLELCCVLQTLDTSQTLVLTDQLPRKRNNNTMNTNTVQMTNTDRQIAIVTTLFASVRTWLRWAPRSDLRARACSGTTGANDQQPKKSLNPVSPSVWNNQGRCVSVRRDNYNTGNLQSAIRNQVHPLFH